MMYLLFNSYHNKIKFEDVEKPKWLVNNVQIIHRKIGKRKQWNTHTQVKKNKINEIMAD